MHTGRALFHSLFWRHRAPFFGCCYFFILRYEMSGSRRAIIKITPPHQWLSEKFLKPFSQTFKHFRAHLQPNVSRQRLGAHPWRGGVPRRRING